MQVCRQYPLVHVSFEHVRVCSTCYLLALYVHDSKAGYGSTYTLLMNTIWEDLVPILWPFRCSSGIKVALPTESATDTCFLEIYIRYILALEKKAGGGRKLPFAIMTSGDTHDRTVDLLTANNYFGMDPSQVAFELG